MTDEFKAWLTRYAAGFTAVTHGDFAQGARTILDGTAYVGTFAAGARRLPLVRSGILEVRR
jgi:hypothetical protein